MTKTQIKNKAITFAVLVNHHLEIISKAQDNFDRELSLTDDETLEFLEKLITTDEDCIALTKRYNELLKKIDF